ncbi:hypothetical protein BGZ65_011876 [Modicella reniformis]|uniref:Uncharacterized protein n=1 Tax=Modicella reniformis TaxID=1440133 RepID=A0A9P6MCU3_9FUNG|nr:hypothetical protein BGZ65_011876 [Modicella reniformis]
MVMLQTKSSQHDDPISVSTTSPSMVLSPTSNDLSFKSGYRPDDDDNTGNDGEKKLKLFRAKNGHGRGSSGSGKSLLNATVFKQRRGSCQVQASRTEPQPQSIADILESAREVHPRYSSNDFDGLDLCDPLGLQGTFQSSLMADPSEHTIQQLYGAPVKREAHSSQTASSKNSNRDMLHNTSSMSASNSSIYSNTSNMAPTANSRTTSSKLGRLSRFKFPLISVGSSQKNKTQVSLAHQATFQEPAWVDANVVLQTAHVGTALKAIGHAWFRFSVDVRFR